MKLSLLSLLALLSAATAAHAEPKGYTYVSEEPMAQDACVERIQDFASQNALTVEEWGPADFYLMGQGEHAGNAYYSEGVCHIYLN